ncbi:hypothetical protein MOP88_17430 [Sphingomonas sp. WKB10]|nr:hypothetical protein [Sphingomonas sp. WKB10]
MTASSKPMAALSSGLLARKGQARPAMRSGALMSFPRPERRPRLERHGAADSVPPVLVQRDLLEAQIGRPAAVAEVALAAAQRIQRETHIEGQTALALRIDADRHLRLRLASAITDRSAQDLLTDALDALLVAVPEVDTLVAQLSRARTRP